MKTNKVVYKKILLLLDPGLIVNDRAVINQIKAIVKSSGNVDANTGIYMYFNKVRTTLPESYSNAIVELSEKYNIIILSAVDSLEIIDDIAMEPDVKIYFFRKLAGNIAKLYGKYSSDKSKVVTWIHSSFQVKGELTNEMVDRVLDEM